MDVATRQIKKSTIATGIILSLIIFYFSLQIFHLLGLSALAGAGSFFISRLVALMFLMLLVTWSIKAEKQPVLLWENKKTSLLHFAVSVVILLVCIIGISVVLDAIESRYGYTDKSDKLQTMLALFKTHKLLLFFTAGTAAIVEEVYFRGYLIPRLQIIFKSPFIAIIISSALFGLAHSGFNNLAQMVNAGFIGLVSAVYYQRFRNIYVVIVSHFIIDIIAIFSKLQ